MIAPPVGARILLATKPVDFRKGAHSLAALAAAVLGADPFSGAVLVFRSRRADRLKILIWDGTGLALVWKQLEGGAFRWPAVVDGMVRLMPGSSPCCSTGSIGGAFRRRGRFPHRARLRRILGTMRAAGDSTPTLPEDPAALRAVLCCSRRGRWSTPVRRRLL